MSIVSKICQLLAGQQGEDLRKGLIDMVYLREVELLVEQGYEAKCLDDPPYIQTNAPQSVRMTAHNEALDAAMSGFLEVWEKTDDKGQRRMLDACMDVFKRSYFSDEDIAKAKAAGN